VSGPIFVSLGEKLLNEAGAWWVAIASYMMMADDDERSGMRAMPRTMATGLVPKSVEAARRGWCATWRERAFQLLPRPRKSSLFCCV